MTISTTTYTADQMDADRLRVNLDRDVDPNRRVHAYDAADEVVRYDRTGKWYIESRLDGTRYKVNVADAAARAWDCYNAGGNIHYDLRGGSAFDRKVRDLHS